MDTDRKQELRAMLMDLRREVAGKVQERVRDVHAEGAKHQNSGVVRDSADVASDDVLEDIELQLIQMKADTLARINDALARLEQGSCGDCDDCSQEIAEKRLRALPFAVRCKNCEEAREVAEQHERELALRRGSAARMLFTFNDERA